MALRKVKLLASSMTAEDAINEIRDRAGVAHVLDRFTGNTTDFLGEIRRERA